MSTRKGKKRLRNQPIFYDEIKKVHGISLTDSSWVRLQQLAKQKGLSISEFIERWVRDTQAENPECRISTPP